MKISFISHAEDKIIIRAFLKQEIIDAIKYPDNIIKKHNKYYFQKKVHRREIEAICEPSARQK